MQDLFSHINDCVAKAPLMKSAFVYFTAELLLWFTKSFGSFFSCLQLADYKGKTEIFLHSKSILVQSSYTGNQDD